MPTIESGPSNLVTVTIPPLLVESGPSNIVTVIIPLRPWGRTVKRLTVEWEDSPFDNLICTWTPLPDVRAYLLLVRDMETDDGFFDFLTVLHGNISRFVFDPYTAPALEEGDSFFFQIVGYPNAT